MMKIWFMAQSTEVTVKSSEQGLSNEYWQTEAWVFAICNDLKMHSRGVATI